MKGFLQYIVALEESYINFGDYNLENKFNHYNSLLFKSEIPALPVVWADNLKNGSHMLGGLTTCQFNKLTRRYVPGSLKIQISTRFKQTEENLDATLIHEMIHAFLTVCGYPDEQHGIRFLTILHAIERKLEIKIPVTDNLSDLELSDNAPTKETLAVVKTNPHTKETTGTFYTPGIARDRAKLETVKEKWHSWVAAGYSVDIFLTTTNIFNRGFSMLRDPNKAPYYVFKPDTVAEIRKNAHYLVQWRAA